MRVIARGQTIAQLEESVNTLFGSEHYKIKEDKCLYHSKYGKMRNYIINYTEQEKRYVLYRIE